MLLRERPGGEREVGVREATPARKVFPHLKSVVTSSTSHTLFSSSCMLSFFCGHLTKGPQCIEISAIVIVSPLSCRSDNDVLFLDGYCGHCVGVRKRKLHSGPAGHLEERAGVVVLREGESPNERTNARARSKWDGRRRLRPMDGWCQIELSFSSKLLDQNQPFQRSSWQNK